MKTYINGVVATKADLFELERKLRLGLAMAFGRCYKGIIYIKTI